MSLDPRPKMCSECDCTACEAGEDACAECLHENGNRQCTECKQWFDMADIADGLCEKCAAPYAVDRNFERDHGVWSDNNN